MNNPRRRSRWRQVIVTLIWTLGLLLLTNVFWSVWGGRDVDHPLAFPEGWRLGYEQLSETRGRRVTEQVRPTRTSYQVDVDIPEIARPGGIETVHEFAHVAPGWLVRQATLTLSSGGTVSHQSGDFEAVGWPVRLLWCGSTVTDGKTRHAVPHSGIRVREANPYRTKLDGLMPIRPILFGELFYGGLWLALVILVPMAIRRLDGLLRECGWDRANRREALKRSGIAILTGRWFTMRRVVAIMLFLLAGLVANLSMAWVCAAWVKPVGDVSFARLTPLRDGGYSGQSRLDRFGRSLVFTTQASSADILPDGSLQRVIWDLDTPYFGEIQAGWPMRAWTCRTDGVQEMSTFQGTLFTGRIMGGLKPTVGGIELTPFSVAGGPNAGREWRALPYHPIWIGAIVDSLFYASIIWLIFILVYARQHVLRLRRGQCTACGYPVGSSAVCTECGAPVRLVITSKE